MLWDNTGSEIQLFFFAKHPVPDLHGELPHVILPPIKEHL